MSAIDDTSHSLIDIEAVATRLGRSQRFVRRLVEDNRIQFVKVGKFVMFDPSHINEWIESRTVPQKHFD